MQLFNNRIKKCLSSLNTRDFYTSQSSQFLGGNTMNTVECSRCYTKKLVRKGRRRIVIRKYLQMKEVDTHDGYRYYQCSRCGRTKKQKIKLFSSGIIENVSRREARNVSKKSGSGIGTAIGLGLVALLIGAAISDNKKS